jgi:hypothetical protein
MPQILNNDYFKVVLSAPDSLIADQLIGMTALQVGVSEAEVRSVLASQLGTADSTHVAGDDEDLRVREWNALVNPAESHDPRDYFITRRAALPSPVGHFGLQPFADVVAQQFTGVVIVHRLREIRVLRGFNRHTMLKTVDPALGKPVDFLPAIEIFGEGVFLRLDEATLREWERTAPVIQRVAVLRQRLAKSFHEKRIDEPLTPRMILIHTLAHLLMRQMSFDAGYSASSLRERLYTASTPDAPLGGLLIYTAAGDSEGSLGGLARLGEAERLIPVLARALGAAQWCSLDPVCGESKGQGTDALSLAACHACALASETSCVLGNVLLDRLLLIDPEFGFFRQEIATLLDLQLDALILCSNFPLPPRCPTIILTY